MPRSVKYKGARKRSISAKELGTAVLQYLSSLLHPSSFGSYLLLFPFCSSRGLEGVQGKEIRKGTARLLLPTGRGRASPEEGRVDTA